MTVPSSLVEMVPSPSLSKRAKASLNEAISSGSRSGGGPALKVPSCRALNSRNLRCIDWAALTRSGLTSWICSWSEPPSSIVSYSRLSTNQSVPICSPLLVTKKARASISMRSSDCALATRHSRTACSCTSAKVLPIIAMRRLSKRMSAMMRYMKRKTTYAQNSMSCAVLNVSNPPILMAGVSPSKASSTSAWTAALSELNSGELAGWKISPVRG
mmetsp:Transcript_56145/g.111450  ORF Transcript_56145/g.111450 Transcript_56145/m.111450 type:complete len:215 (+) Transcript_56145:607-1251(+)